MEIEDLLGKPEGKTLEFKRDLSSPAGVLRTVVAFANTAGGTLVIGVDSRTRAVVGLVDPLLEEAERDALVARRGFKTFRHHE